ncbi:unnamed protein product [Hymenolepis diminuta]|uniref:non-specific serine/threonine protein kinase n=1 Tax=Hymenolepis diminuta TaxID=6216 RepID=A0A564YH14_HYMDI|nr:unnamed protein product [Hymenolepis diminuta]
MAPQEFCAKKFLGCGSFSFVFSVTSLLPHDRGESYALKRYFLRRNASVLYAKRECDILKKITLDPHASPFLPTLYYSLVIELSPVLVLTEALGLTLLDLIAINGPLTVKQMKFYAAEIICGLKYLHERHIVHMELKPNNVLITKSGHILISDFDRSYHLSEGNKPPCRRDFFVNPYFSAPEIAKEEVITDKADVWSLGVLTAWLIGKSIRSQCNDYDPGKKAAEEGHWKIDEFSKLPKRLQEFFNRVFTHSYLLRPSIEQVQSLTLFKNVNWYKVERLKVKPPFSIDRLINFIDGMNRDHNPTDPVLLQTLYTFQMPEVENCMFQYGNDLVGRRYFKFVQPNLTPQGWDDITPQGALDELKGFNFIHPVLNYRRLLSK